MSDQPHQYTVTVMQEVRDSIEVISKLQGVSPETYIYGLVHTDIQARINKHWREHIAKAKKEKANPKEPGHE